MNTMEDTFSIYFSGKFHDYKIIFSYLEEKNSLTNLKITTPYPVNDHS